MIGLPILLALIVGLLTLIVFFRRKYRFFKDLGILHIKPLPIFGNMAPFLFRRKALPDLLMETYYLNQEAKYVGFYQFVTPTIMIRDPELIKSITVKNFDHFVDHRGFGGTDDSEIFFTGNLFNLRGDEWRKMRNLLTPAFTSLKMKAMFKLMSDCGRDFAEFVEKEAAGDKVINAKDIFTKYTNDTIATCAFGISVNSMRDPNNDFFRMGKEATNLNDFVTTIKFFLKQNCPGLLSLLGVKLFPDHVAKFFKNIVATTIQKRDEEGIYRPDMIQLMMESRGKGEKDLTIDEMTAQAFIFFFGGFDSTSNMMCMTSHMIATHPEVQEKLHREVDEVLARNNGELTYETLNSMPYMDAVLDETNRVYSPVPFLDRVCVKAFELPPALPGADPVLLKPGMNVWMPPYALQRDPKYFPDPERFDPERFLGGKKDVDPFVYMPFGVGPRMCIGNRFALMEVKVVLTHMLARCEFVPSPKTKFPIKLSKKTFVMAPEEGFWLKFRSRKC